MNTIAVLSRKGGVGKSTVAIHLAVAAQAAGRRTLLIDGDPQRSAGAWWSSRAAETPEMVEIGVGELAKVKAAALVDGVDLVVIDTRPSAEGDALEAARAADLSLIVVRPSVLDLRAVAATVEVVNLAGGRGLVVVNAAPPGRGESEAAIVIEAVEALAGFGLPVAPIILHQRAAYSTALIDGRAVAELEPRGKAAAEIKALWCHIEEILR